jgi:hypothetical protein
MERNWITLDDLSNVVPAVQPAWLYIHSRWDVHNGEGTKVIRTEWCDDLYPVLAYAIGTRKSLGGPEGVYLVSSEMDGPVWVVHSSGDVTTVLYSHGVTPTPNVARMELNARFPAAFDGKHVATAHPLQMDPATPPEFVIGP